MSEAIVYLTRRKGIIWLVWFMIEYTDDDCDIILCMSLHDLFVAASSQAQNKGPSFLPRISWKTHSTSQDRGVTWQCVLHLAGYGPMIDQGIAGRRWRYT